MYKANGAFSMKLLEKVRRLSMLVLSWIVSTQYGLYEVNHAAPSTPLGVAPAGDCEGFWGGLLQ
jgi:hypothetical protein